MASGLSVLVLMQTAGKLLKYDASSGSGNVSNPDTGANDAMGVAVALGAASLVAAAAVSLKKSR